MYRVFLESDVASESPVRLWIDLSVLTLTPEHAEGLGQALLEQSRIAREHGSWVTKMRGTPYWDGRRYVSDDVEG